MAEDGPAGYYVGRPMNYDDQKSQPPPPATSQAAGEQVNAQVPGYYAGRVPGKKAAGGDQSSAAADQTSKEPGFLASCFGCFSGGQTAK